MDYTQITFEKRGRAGLITLNRPEKLNAWTQTMFAEMHDAMEQCRADRDVAAVVVTGAGRAFCSGADIAEVFKANADAQDRGQQREASGPAVNWVDYVLNYPKPTIAAVNGAAVGIGITMILPFDIRIASTEARIGMFFVRMGLVPELASSAFIAQMVGSARALEWCLTGRLIPAAEAHAAGMVAEVAEPDALLDRAVALAGQLGGNSALAMTLIRKLIRENATTGDIAAAMQHEGAALRQTYASWEQREAIAAFMEKREPDFTGKEPTLAE